MVDRKIIGVTNLPFRFTVETPKGKRWARSFHNENAAWNCLVGACRKNESGVGRFIKKGYKVVPIAFQTVRIG